MSIFPDEDTLYYDNFEEFKYNHNNQRLYEPCDDYHNLFMQTYQGPSTHPQEMGSLQVEPSFEQNPEVNDEHGDESSSHEANLIDEDFLASCEINDSPCSSKPSK